MKSVSMPSSAVKLEGDEDALGEAGKASGSDAGSSSPRSQSELTETDERAAGGGKTRKTDSDRKNTGRKVNSYFCRTVVFLFFSPFVVVAVVVLFNHTDEKT